MKLLYFLFSLTVCLAVADNYNCNNDEQCDTSHYQGNRMFCNEETWGDLLCHNCFSGYVSLYGECQSHEDVAATITWSKPVDELVFLQSDHVYTAYQNLFRDGPTPGKTSLHKSVAHLFLDEYDDAYNFVWISTFEEPIACAPLAEDECLIAVGCGWAGDSCQDNGGEFPDMYFTENVWDYKNLKGYIMWNYQDNHNDDNAETTTMDDYFWSHWHEMAHNWLQHGYAPTTNAIKPAHWGTTGLDQASTMGGYTGSLVKCMDPPGAEVTPDSCNADADGKTYLFFPDGSGSVWSGADQYSDWDLFTMGLMPAEDLEGQTFFHCEGDLDQTHEDVALDGEAGTKWSCDQVTFYDTESWSNLQMHQVDDTYGAGGTYGRRNLGPWVNGVGPTNVNLPFRGAHVVLMPNSASLPQSYDDLSPRWKSIADHLALDLPLDFQAQTRGYGAITFKIQDPGTQCWIYRDDAYITGCTTSWWGNDENCGSETSWGAEYGEECSLAKELCMADPLCTTYTTGQAWSSDGQVFTGFNYHGECTFDPNYLGASWSVHSYTKNPQADECCWSQEGCYPELNLPQSEPVIPGCTIPQASNYNADASLEDGSCIFLIPGCTHPQGNNYNPAATEDDGSCIIPGCTNPEASNFNADATDDDGSCVIDDSGVCSGCIAKAESALGCDRVLELAQNGIPANMQDRINKAGCASCVDSVIAHCGTETEPEMPPLLMGRRLLRSRRSN